MATVLVPTAVRLTRQAVHDLVLASSPLRAADVLLFLALNFWQPAVAAALAVWGFTRRRSRQGARVTPRTAARPRAEAALETAVTPGTTGHPGLEPSVE
jgi:hypothetical protein